MKKNKLLSLLSALLCIVMLLASCDDPGSGSGDGEKGDGDGTNAFTAISAEWFEYLQYNADYEAESYEPAVNTYLEFTSNNTEILGGFGSKYLLFTVDYGFGSDRNEIYEDPTPENPDDSDIFIGYRTTLTLTYKAINLYNGETVWSKSVSTKAIVSEASYYITRDHLVSFDVADTAYSFTAYGNSGFFQVCEKTDVTPAPTNDEPNPTTVYEYSYVVYDAYGVALTSAAEDKYDVEVDGNEVVIGNDKYIVVDTKIVKKIGAYEFFIEHAVSLEFGDYKYAFFEGDSMDMDGDGIYTTPLYIQLFDAEFDLVFENVMEFSDSYFTKVLTNGDILVCLNNELAENAEEYDFTYEGDKFTQNVYIVSLAGVATELDLPYVIEYVDNSVDSNLTFSIKDNYNLLYAYTLDEDKRILSDIKFYVVDNTLATVKELTPLVKGQSYIDFISEYDMIVSANTGIGPLNYRVTKYGSAPTLYASDYGHTTLKNGTFFVQSGNNMGVLYSKDLGVIKNFNDYSYDSVTLLEEKGIFIAESENSDGETAYTIYYFNDSLGLNSRTVYGINPYDFEYTEIISRYADDTVHGYYYYYNSAGEVIYGITESHCIGGMPYVESIDLIDDTVYRISYTDTYGDTHTEYFK